ncbi:hypothetical protein QYE76_004921 [Lolium multiflorum]|uniref:Transposase n=1 Tax=Lolium multiflorum TaxID=4521 RepID=A0AAD8RRN0_LOLMU|nr:hypothetical protein QYE76_004921 [Lolium multiflorum]
MMAEGPPPPLAELAECCRELDEGHHAWAAHRKEAAWRLKRVELQLESERACRRREAAEEFEAKMRALWKEEYAPGYLEVPHLQYYDEVLNTFPEIKSDQELMTMFEKHSETKSVQMFIQYCDPSEPYTPITKYVQPNSKTSQDEDSYLRNPLPENEHVGIDEEENMYSDKEPIPLNVVLFADKEKDRNYFPEDVSVDESEDESEVEEDEEVQEPNHAPNVEYDREDPPMTVGSTYPNMNEFKLAIRQHAVKRDFEFNTEKSAPHRFTAHCKRKDEDNCPWRIHASTTDDLCTVVVKTNPFDHDCSSTKNQKKVKNATKHWICEKVKDWLIEDATLGADELRKKLKEHYKIKIHYKRVYMEGFRVGCRPYLAVDSTFLTGRFKGQLASATAVDGHNWMYPVCFGVFDSETNENWTWFMQLLRQAIGSPLGLAICTDAGQAVMTGVKEVFPEAEHRECMFHLVSNFKKKFHGKVFDDHLWAAAYSWNPYVFDKHWVAMEEATAGRPKTERYKGCGDKKSKRGKHLCPICKDYGHHWHNCKKGNPDDIAAMMAVR